MNRCLDKFIKISFFVTPFPQEEAIRTAPIRRKGNQSTDGADYGLKHDG